MKIRNRIPKKSVLRMNRTLQTAKAGKNEKDIHWNVINLSLLDPFPLFPWFYQKVALYMCNYLLKTASNPEILINKMKQRQVI